MLKALGLFFLVFIVLNLIGSVDVRFHGFDQLTHIGHGFGALVGGAIALLIGIGSIVAVLVGLIVFAMGFPLFLLALLLSLVLAPIVLPILIVFAVLGVLFSSFFAIFA